MNDGNSDEFSAAKEAKGRGGEGGGEASTKRKCVNSLNIHVYLRAVCI